MRSTFSDGIFTKKLKIQASKRNRVHTLNRHTVCIRGARRKAGSIRWPSGDENEAPQNEIKSTSCHVRDGDIEGVSD